MQYLLTLYTDESGWSRMTPEQQQQGTAAYMAYTEALRSAGALVGSNRLQTPQPPRRLFAQRMARRRCLTDLSLNRKNNWPAIT